MRSLQPQKTLMDQVYETILDAICDGTLKPGDRVAQDDVASRLKVSRQPVTHALAVLKSQGFLESAGGQRLTVSTIDPATFEAIYQLRSAIEPLAVRLASPRLDPSAFRRGCAIIDRGRKMLLAGDHAGVAKADVDFHIFIHRLSGNALIEETIRLHWWHLRRALAHFTLHVGMSDIVWDEHQHILDGMMHGDVDAAAETMRRHLVGAAERVKKNNSSKTLTPVRRMAQKKKRASLKNEQ